MSLQIRDKAEVWRMDGGSLVIVMLRIKIVEVWLGMKWIIEVHQTCNCETVPYDYEVREGWREDVLDKIVREEVGYRHTFESLKNIFPDRI